MTPTIQLSGVGKRYVQSEDDAMLLKRLAKSVTRRRNNREIWALRDIDLDVAAGESVGVIGRNGSGKTTMLRLMSGVSAPSVGRLMVRGSIAPLIGVGVGFHPELTGRENVSANGQILGMSKAQIAQRFDSILDFAELEDFVDTPVKFYSSGMFLRLAFAIAVHNEPEVFLVDEVLAVGDAAFQMKCFDRLEELRAGGMTMVFVTHNLDLLSRMCDRVAVLSHGSKVFEGGADDAVARYHEIMNDELAERNERTNLLDQRGTDPLLRGGCEVKLTPCDDAGNPVQSIRAGEPLAVRLDARFGREHQSPMVGLYVSKAGSGGIYMSGMAPGEYDGVHGPDRPMQAILHLDTPVLEGTYSVAAQVTDADGSEVLGRATPVQVYVRSASRAGGVSDLRCRIEIDGAIVSDLTADLPSVRQ